MTEFLSGDDIRDFVALYDEHIAELSAASKDADFDAGYYAKHRDRFAKILAFLPVGTSVNTAIEYGATAFFQVVVPLVLGAKTMVGTIFSPHVADKRYRRTFSIGTKASDSLVLSLDLERDNLPFADESVDFILCSEVVEHLDIDPMFMMAEINRLLRPDGWLLMTTPNACSARNFWKIAHGFRPHFFMQYEKSRSPYRHNIEYDRHSVALLAEAAGLSVERLETHDVFEPTHTQSLAFLKQAGLPIEDRGDCIFMLARKTGPVRDRWPGTLYV